MECWVKTGDGRIIQLPTVTEWTFCYGTGTPCDSYELKCLWDMGQELALADACRFYAEHEGERVFTGVVDEYACVFDSKGARLELSGRGMAALLLDNEALPAEYQSATAADIVADHVTPYGIETVGGGSLRPVSALVVSSGGSEWSVVQDFLCYYNGLVPRFDRRGRLVLDKPDDTMALVVDDSTPVSALEYRQDRYGVLSQVVVRRRTAGNSQSVTDEDFIAQGGRARRVVTVPNTTGTAAMRYTGDYQLKASQSERVRCSLTAAGGFSAQPGQLVKVARTGFGGNGTYRVAQAQVSCDENGLYTRLELGETDSMI
jgi:prophage tail gpP-like protein